MSNNTTVDIKAGEELNWDDLEACLRTNISGLEGEMSVRQFPGGNSNLTYEVKFGSRSLVLRRPPFGTRPKSGHSMHREYFVMSALKDSSIHVPQTLFYTDDESVIGAEFYVMERVEGTLIRNQFPSEWSLSNDEKRALVFRVFDELIALHNTDIEAVGLTEFGKPEGYIERQIGGWNKRFNKAKTDDVDDFLDVQAWLESNRPSKEIGACIVHGDFRLDNVIIDSDTREVGAVLDWEISALGDPLMDLGNTLAYWIQADDPDYMKGLITQPSMDEGMPTRDEILAYYSSKTGIDTTNFKFYLVYGYWRNLVILQQIYYRYYHGQTQDQRFAMFKAAVNAMGNHCRKLVQLPGN
ncbi:phosphotransferase family protein [uncultured Umboniibacter sp.]|uniref:phosphotransferase family protein n=1 Tax=uncultured Umboniibacter sp. TaxID=1798917 RepID=UPI00260CB22E|nr:phosphotransferase family protein [uncultured Umboniibacter sp.]